MSDTLYLMVVFRDQALFLMGNDTELPPIFLSLKYEKFVINFLIPRMIAILIESGIQTEILTSIVFRICSCNCCQSPISKQSKILNIWIIQVIQNVFFEHLNWKVSKCCRRHWVFKKYRTGNNRILLSVLNY